MTHPETNAADNAHRTRGQAIEKAVRPAFERNFSEHAELGAAVAIFSAQENAKWLYLTGGFRDRDKTQPWTDDTLVLLWSATKGLEAACVLAAMEHAGVGPDDPLAAVWPELAKMGRERLTLANVLNHQAGIPVLDDPAPSILNHEEVVAALERQRPHWEPGTAHGYHVRVFGFLCDELVRRMAEKTLATAWREWFADPLGLDIWIGLPREHHHCVAEVVAARGFHKDPAESAFYEAFLLLPSLTRRAFSSPRGLNTIGAMNAPEIREAPIASLGSIGDARSLARFYAALANHGEIGGVRVLAAQTLAWMDDHTVCGRDAVLQIDTSFSLGFMRDPVDSDGRKLRAKFGPSTRAFGHPGAGGVNAFADPDQSIGFAYVMNQMSSGVLPNIKSLTLLEAAYEAMVQPA